MRRQGFHASVFFEVLRWVSCKGSMRSVMVLDALLSKAQYHSSRRSRVRSPPAPSSISTCPWCPLESSAATRHRPAGTTVETSSEGPAEKVGVSAGVPSSPSAKTENTVLTASSAPSAGAARTVSRATQGFARRHPTAKPDSQCATARSSRQGRAEVDCCCRREDRLHRTG